MTIKEQIKQFATEENIQAKLIKNENIELYLRIKNVWINGQKTKSVVVANIVIAEHLRGKGIFSAIVKTIAKTTQHKMIYIECIGNPRLVEKLKKEGWVFDGEGDINYYKNI